MARILFAYIDSQNKAINEIVERIDTAITILQSTLENTAKLLHQGAYIETKQAKIDTYEQLSNVLQ